MNLAYIILAHRNPQQLFRLVDRLDNEGVTFVFHISKASDKGFDKEMRKLFRDKKNVYFCKREDGTHNHFGIVKGTINALKLLFEKNIAFDYVSLLSGQDYPIKSNREINRFLEENKGREYLQFWPLFPAKDSEFFNDHPWGPHRQIYRIDRYHIKFCGKKQSIPELLTARLTEHSLYKTLKIFIYESPKYLREKRWKEEFLLFSLSRILPQKRKIPGTFEVYGGKTWWTFTRECSEYIVKFYDNNPKFNRFFRYTLIPDEMYFQTLLMNSPFAEKVENDYLREIEWEGGDGTHPIVFKKEHFQRLKDSAALFARKFDTDIDGEIFDEIDSELLNK